MAVEMEQTITVQFLADNDAPEVPDTPCSLPLNLGKRELTEIVNHLLGKTEPSDNLKFDFLINGDLLRSSLENFIKKRGISQETVLVIHYFEPSPPPEENLVLEHEDWVTNKNNNPFFTSFNLA